jgi:SAM-dependent methyltransferase
MAAAPPPSQHALVDRQFGPRAAAYVASPTHATGPDLDRLAAVAAGMPGARALDLGCGGGHAAYAIAPHVGSVIACDLSGGMLEAVAREAGRRGLSNITTRQTRAEHLPFADRAFDLLVCRLTAHHWLDLDAGLREARRVLKPGAVALFSDVVAPAHPLADTHLQAIELLRDPSHVRDYGAGEWLSALGRAGFAVTAMRTHPLPLAFDGWVARMDPPAAHVEAIRSLQSGASSMVRDALAIEADGSFAITVALFETWAG